MNDSKPKLGILGAGKLGVVLAQLATRAGYTVYIAGSNTPDKIRLSMEVLAPATEVMSAEDVAKQADIIILALPLGKYRTIPYHALANKIVVDAMNYWWEVDGERDDLRSPASSTSELVQAFLDKSRVVKAFSHIGYHHLHDDAKPIGAPGRKAMAIAGDNEKDTKVIANIVNDLGFDSIIIGRLHTGKQLEPGHKAFGAHVDTASLRKILSD